jgi:hypothetical protein
MLNPEATDEEMLVHLQKRTLAYFLSEGDDETGLIRDKSQPDAPASIAVTGMGLSCYAVAVALGCLTREDAAARTLRVLRFCAESEQSTRPDATGFKGFYYHFLDMKTGRRAWNCELSTVDTAILMAGILSVRHYFTGDNDIEHQICALAESLYARVDWQWAQNGKESITHGWKPETGFLRYRWSKAYSEAHILYILALGAPDFPIAAGGYEQWTAAFDWAKIYDYECFYAGPLFIHQLSQLWLDFRGIRDRRNREHNVDYFENSGRATRIQRQYAIANPKGFKGYGATTWGVTASNGPGPSTRSIHGVQRKFLGYKARGAPYGPDDGTISPWAAAASIPFAPEIVLPTIRHSFECHGVIQGHEHGFDESFNPSYPGTSDRKGGWVSPWQFGLSQGPIILMIQNYKDDGVWNLFKQSPHVVRGLRKAGFTGGWLDEHALHDDRTPNCV